MIKKLIALVLCLCLAVAAFPFEASAAQTDEIRNQIVSHYQAALEATGKESLGGYCGLMTSWQLYLMGINSYLMVNDGNKQFDAYKNMKMTTGGYRVKAYPAAEYTFTEAMYTATGNGKRDVYNLLVGFQWTSTEAGATYGHAVVIYAIIDGIVYFTEGFATSMGTADGGVIAITLDEFIDYYDDWTRFDGVIVFGTKDYAGKCEILPSHMFATAEEDVVLLSQPCPVGTEDADSHETRRVRAGERLLVTGIMKNTLEEYYYRVDDGEALGYLPVDRLTPMQQNVSDVLLREAALPVAMVEGKDYKLGGTIAADYSQITKVWMNILDEQGETLLSHGVDKQSGAFRLESGGFNEALDFGALPAGNYICSLNADCESNYIEQGELKTMTQSTELFTQPFAIGQTTVKQKAQTEAPAQRDGWIWENNTWYYYRQGTPVSGWFLWEGIDYYLREDGSVSTGWVGVNGKNRYFTVTGAMHTGWLERGVDRVYLLSNGEPAVGWRTVDGKRYLFDSTGAMQRDCWYTKGDYTYYFLSDGSAATGWVDLPQGRFGFDIQGHLLAQEITEQDRTLIYPCTEYGT